MSKDGQEIHSFEESGLWAWQQILEGKTPQDILEAIVEEYEVAEDRAKADLEEFFSDLLEKGIAK